MYCRHLTVGGREARRKAVQRQAARRWMTRIGGAGAAILIAPNSVNRGIHGAYESP
jgi:hypothetical protein